MTTQPLFLGQPHDLKPDGQVHEAEAHALVDDVADGEPAGQVMVVVVLLLLALRGESLVRGVALVQGVWEAAAAAPSAGAARGGPLASVA